MRRVVLVGLCALTGRDDGIQLRHQLLAFFSAYGLRTLHLRGIFLVHQRETSGQVLPLQRFLASHFRFLCGFGLFVELFRQRLNFTLTRRYSAAGVFGVVEASRSAQVCL